MTERNVSGKRQKKRYKCGICKNTRRIPGGRYYKRLGAYYDIRIDPHVVMCKQCVGIIFKEAMKRNEFEKEK